MNACYMRPAPCRISPVRFSSGLKLIRSSVVQQCEAHRHKVGDLILGPIKDIKSNVTYVDLGDGVIGQLPISQVSMQRVENATDIWQIEEEIKAMVLKVDDRRILLSTKLLEQSPGDIINNRQLVFDNAEEVAARFRSEAARIRRKAGELIVGTVLNIEKFGAFVDLGEGATGLLHINQISSEKVKSAHDVFKVEEKIKVLILAVDEDRGRILLSTIDLEPKPGDMINNRQAVFDNAEEMAVLFRQRMVEEKAKNI